MDAFYASVEQRDNLELRGKPVIVAWRAKRRSFVRIRIEARAFGLRSANAGGKGGAAVPASRVRVSRLQPQSCGFEGDARDANAEQIC